MPVPAVPVPGETSSPLTLLAPGQPLHVRYTKWDGGPHWAYDNVVLGTDQHGVWLGGPSGTPMERPGAAFVTHVDNVQCFAVDRGHAATFWSDHAEPDHAAVYVDITTVPVWLDLGTPDAEVTLVDLDLDVIRLFNGRLFVDDEDEFADHLVRYGYPGGVIAAAEEECRAVYRAMEQGDEPYGSVGRSWLERFTRR